MAMVSLLLTVMMGASAARRRWRKARARATRGEDAGDVGVDHWDCWLSSKLILTS